VLTMPGLTETKRDETIDFVKGGLVLVMVLYHWLNYFVKLDWDIYRYLRFVTPSFILLTGFVVSRFYLQRYAYDSPQLRRRLIQRGFKLLLLFFVLNLLSDLLAGGMRLGAPQILALRDRAVAVLVAGEGRAVFSILVPIAYFLILAPVVLLVSKRTGVSLIAIAAAAVIVMSVADLNGLGNSHLQLIAVALVGLAAGQLNAIQPDSILVQPVPLVLAYAIYLWAITVWNVLFPLQVIGVCLTVALIYVAALRWGTGGSIQQGVVLLGKYSLFCYVTQIIALQVLRRGLSNDLPGAAVLIPLVACLLLTILAVELTAFFRTRFTVADSMYKTVFA
jgi:peptidoglycan/LPS O-acetylase OafA/YrhL